MKFSPLPVKDFNDKLITLALNNDMILMGITLFLSVTAHIVIGVMTESSHLTLTQSVQKRL